jgi:hypothetical protein
MDRLFTTFSLGLLVMLDILGNMIGVLEVNNIIPVS